MKNVSQLTSSEVRIFPPDIIPFRRLVTPLATNALKSVLGFSDSGTNPEAGDLVFQHGTLQLPDSVVIVIPLLTIGDRKIVVQVAGTSEEAELVFSGLIGILEKIGTESSLSEPLVVAKETRCVVDLDFSWSDLLSPGVMSFTDALLVASEASGVRPSLKGGSLRLVLRYNTPERLEDYGAGLSDKMFTIEPRNDIPTNQNRFYTMSPTGSGAHLKLLQRLESLMKRKGRKKPPLRQS
jgi:hypothetical protein